MKYTSGDRGFSFEDRFFSWDEVDAVTYEDGIITIYLLSNEKVLFSQFSDDDGCAFVLQVERDCDKYRNGNEYKHDDADELADDNYVRAGVWAHKGVIHDCTIYFDGTVILDDGTKLYIPSLGQE